MTVRADILANIETALQGVTALQDVFIGKLAPVPDLDSIRIPTAWVFPGEEHMAETPASMETWNWSIVIEVWGKDSLIEGLLGSIHTALAADVTRGGHALNCYRDGASFFVVDPARSLGAMQLTYRILYRHPFGQP